MFSKSVFGTCSGTTLIEIAGAREPRSFPAGAVLFSEGTDVTGAYCLCSGAVTVRKRDRSGIEHDVGTIRAGELIGFRNPTERGEYEVTAVAHTDATACFFPIEQIERLTLEHPAILLRLVQSFCRRIDELDSRCG
jgi:CRP-like cAMP-binding protein